MELAEDVQYLEQAGFKASVAVRFGAPAEAITRFVAEEQIDLVAVATHGRSGLLHLALSSTVESVLRRVNVPVLMVRPVRSPTITEGRQTTREKMRREIVR